MEKLKAGVLELDRLILGAGRLGEEEKRMHALQSLIAIWSWAFARWMLRVPIAMENAKSFWGSI